MAGLLAWSFGPMGQVRKEAAQIEYASAEGLARHLIEQKGSYHFVGCCEIVC